MSRASRSIYEYMGNKKWLQVAAREEAGQSLLPGFAPVQPLDLDHRFTLRHTLDWCKQKAGVTKFDLDVAACHEAHVCSSYFTVTENGLARPWSGRVWCNPPYSDIEPWVRKAWEEMLHGRVDLVAMLLPATRTEQPWWQELIEPWREGRGSSRVGLGVHFLPARQSFGIPGNPLGVGVGSPPFGCVLVVWRPR